MTQGSGKRDSRQLKLAYTRVVKGHTYFRHPSTGSVRIRGQRGTAQFQRHHADLLAVVEQHRTQPTVAGHQKDSLAWLIEKYERSPEFKALSPLTRKDYSKYLGVLQERAGDLPYRTLNKRAVIAIRNAFSETPRKANYLVQVLSVLMTWVVDQGWADENPLMGVKKLKGKGDGYTPWSEPQIAHFLAYAEEKVPHVWLGVMLGLHTGQRVGDVVAMEWSQYLGGEVRVRQSKTGELLDIPASLALKEALENAPRGGDGVARILLNANKRPYKNPNTFATALGRAVKASGLPLLSFHGLRYAQAARLEAAGCTLAQITSIIGHRAYQMAVQYATKRANAQGAIVNLS